MVGGIREEQKMISDFVFEGRPAICWRWERDSSFNSHHTGGKVTEQVGWRVVIIV